MNAENAKLEYEAGQAVAAMGALTDSGDATIFTSAASIWSGRDGYAANILPDGLKTGGVVSAAVSGSNNVVDITALTANVAGAVRSVSAQVDEAITRPATAVAKINSITVTSAGAIAVVAGTDGSDGNFSETRGAAGGPPYIPTTSIEIAQVRIDSDTAAPIDSSEIFQVVGVHQERFDYPGYTINNDDGKVEFNSALDLIHTGDVPKAVHASYAEPIFAEVSYAYNFVPAETSHSISSKQVYGSTRGSSSSSLGQASFSAELGNGVTDALVSLKDETLWFRFYPNRNQTQHVLTQGKLGLTRSFPADGAIEGSFTLTADRASIEREA